MESLARLNDLLGRYREIVTFVGVLLAGVPFVWSQIQQIRLRNEDRYLNLSERWHNFLALSLDNLDTGANDYMLPVAALDTEALARRNTIFEMQTSIFERAHLLYAGRRHTSQWKGWEEYISFYCGRPDYQDWASQFFSGGPGYDLAFARYMSRLLVAGRGAPEWIQRDGQWRRA